MSKRETKKQRDEETKCAGLRTLCLLVSSSLCLFLTTACSDKKPSTQPSSVRERQDALLRDPFSYKTDEPADISGGKLNELDRNALKKDMDHVLNP